MRSYRTFAVTLLLVCAGLTPMAGKTQTEGQPEVGVSAEILESRIQEAEASAEVGEGEKSALLDLYRRSLSLIRQRQAHEVSTREYIEMRETAPRKASELREQIVALEAKPGAQLPAAMANQSLQQLDQLLQSEKASLAGLRGELAEVTALQETLSLRPQLVRERIKQARDRQTEIAEKINLPATAGQPQQFRQAQLWAMQLETRSLASEIEMLSQELLSQPMRLELTNAQREELSLKVARQQQYVDQISALVSERRVSDAETAQQAAEETERQTFGKHELVQEFARENTRLGNELNQMAAEVQQIRDDESVVNDQIKRFSESYRLARQKLEIAGLSQALGHALLQQRNTLPRAKDFRSAEKRRQQLVVDSSLRQLRNQQERSSLSDLEVYIDELVAPLSSPWQSWVREELRDLALQRRELLDKAIAADDSLLQALSELDFSQRELSKVVSDYNRFMDERLLWVRTGEPPSWDTLFSMWQVLGIFASAENWTNLGRALFVPQTFPWPLMVGIPFFALLLVKRQRVRDSLHRSGQKVGQLRHDRLLFSIRALVLTLMLALPWPVLFVTLGLNLQYVQAPDQLQAGGYLYSSADWSGLFVPSIGAAFLDIALYSFYFSAFRIFCAPGGLAAAHFRWRPSTTKLLRRETLRLMWVFLPSVFMLVAIITYQPEALAGGTSRLLLCIVIGALAWFIGRILSPAHGALRDFYRDHPGHILTWLRFLWLALGLLLPTLLAVLATAGFVYTAAQLGARMVDTLWLLVAVILIHQLVVRWMLLIERQVEFREALERHRTQRAARDSQDGDFTPADNVEEPDIDIVALSGDTKKLINSALIVVSAVGLWAIWSDVVPAFRILDEVSLWSYTITDKGVEQLVPVTLGNVITGLLIIVLGSIAARWLPALMEIALFTRFNITAGTRYAISKLTQYSIIAVGIVMVFSVLGGSWGEIQWLIAALGVGIGFGLQEIIANFISGLILLFERPIRIGDIVTVGDTSGVVTKIRIRSTTIRNWDQQELLVPNKEFITGRLLNWTLSDPIARIVISVGIAYGSDVEKALKIVIGSAEQHERILKDPAPMVTFERFGDNALEIMLRCYIDSMDYRLMTVSELNQAINREMQAAGIVIAFPQRDIHLDTSQPLDVRLHRVAAEPAAD